ncbi:MAG: hypothetical protein LCH39_15460 [Proteobacteria bacterium]|nr:hypothetical protein [Pseudomonadota bacterium]
MPSDLPAVLATYEHRPKPFSHPLTLKLRAKALEAERGSRSQTYVLEDVEMIRLTYSPKNTQRMGFSCFLRMRDGRSISFSNLDWRSMVENARQDEPYASFVRALVAALAKANPKVVLRAGLTPWRYGLFSVGALVILPALAVAVFYLIREKNWPLVALASALTIWLGFYAREYAKRNRPRAFDASTVPPEVLPPAS